MKTILFLTIFFSIISSCSKTSSGPKEEDGSKGLSGTISSIFTPFPNAHADDKKEKCKSTCNVDLNSCISLYLIDENSKEFLCSTRLDGNKFNFDVNDKDLFKTGKIVQLVTTNYLGEKRSAIISNSDLKSDLKIDISTSVLSEHIESQIAKGISLEEIKKISSDKNFLIAKLKRLLAKACPKEFKRDSDDEIQSKMQLYRKKLLDSDFLSSISNDASFFNDDFEPNPSDEIKSLLTQRISADCANQPSIEPTSKVIVFNNLESLISPLYPEISNLQYNTKHVYVNDVKIQKDGKILILGTLEMSEGKIFILRLESDGTLDKSFSKDGIFLKMPYIDGNHIPYLYEKIMGLTSNIPVNLVLQEDGKIIFGIFNQGFVVYYRINIDGSIDTSYGTNGGRVIPRENWQCQQNPSIPADGGIITTDASGYNLRRIDQAGNIDTNFDLTKTFVAANPLGGTCGTQFIEGTNDFLLAGTVLSEDGQGLDGQVIKYDYSGKALTSFGENGVKKMNNSLRYTVVHSITKYQDSFFLLTGGFTVGAIDSSFDIYGFDYLTATPRSIGAREQRIPLTQLYPGAWFKKAKVYNDELFLIGSKDGPSRTPNVWKIPLGNDSAITEQVLFKDDTKQFYTDSDISHARGPLGDVFATSGDAGGSNKYLVIHLLGK